MVHEGGCYVLMRISISKLEQREEQRNAYLTSNLLKDVLHKLKSP